MSTRRIIATYAFVMFFLVIALLGTVTAAFGGTSYTEAAGRQSLYTLTAAKARGTIYDRNLQPLTNAERVYVAAVIPSRETLAKLNRAVPEEKREVLRTALESGKPFLIEVTTPVSDDGIQTFSVTKRYANPQPAANLLGYLDSDYNGADGVEKSFDALLAENHGEIDVTFAIDALGNAISGETMHVENTYRIADGGVMLTLDKRIQQCVENACAEIKKGAAVILDCKTGEILASASFPAVDPNDLAACMENENAPFVNRALCAYTPGSVFKLICAASALEYGIDYKEVYTCTGSIVVDGLTITCYGGKAHGEVNLHTALRSSCNGYFIQLAQKLGAEKILSMAEKLGFGTSVSLADNLETAAGSLSNAQALKNARALALFSFGQGETTVSPLNLAAAVNAIAADGIYMTPQLVYGMVDTNLSVQETEENTGEKVMEPTTAARLRAYMESTARFGTARIGAPQNCVSGIKTGTAQTGVYDENGEEIENYWYAGYICNAQEEPLYTLVVLEETAGEMYRRLSAKSAKHLSILIDKPVKKHYNKIRMRGGDMASLNLEDMQQIQKELQAKYLEKWGGLSPKIGRDKLLWMMIEAGEVADIIKKKGDDAILNDPETRHHFTEEVCDVLMYLNDVLLCYGITPNEVENVYLEKHKRNMSRW